MTMQREQEREREIRMTAQKCAEYGAIAYARKADQQTARYDPLGGTDTRACANCLFFMSPNGCTVVEDWPVPISPTGLSQYWTAIPTPAEMPPMKVIIVESEEEEGDHGGMMKMIRHENGKYVLYSKDGSRKLGTYDTREEAEARERQVRRFSDDGDGDKDKGLLARLLAAVKGVFSADADADADADAGDKAILPEPATTGAFRVYKDVNGAWRWVALVSNKYRDRDTPPEILADAAHREYVDYLDKSGDYPEAWLWHTPGTRWGKADWADYVDGFLVMSGTVDKGFEHVAEAIAAEPTGVSHGFYQQYSDKARGIIGWYRTFEVSALPPEAAANQWTAMSAVQKEARMPISPARRAYIEDKLGKDRVAALENDVSALAKALQDAGVDYKDLLTAGASDAGAEGTATATADPGLSAKAVEDAVTKAITPLTASLQELAGTVAAVKANSDQIPGMLERLAALEKSDDEKIAAAFTAKAGGAGAGYRATQSAETALKEGDAADVHLQAARPLIDPGFLKSLSGV